MVHWSRLGGTQGNVTGKPLCNMNEFTSSGDDLETNFQTAPPIHMKMPGHNDQATGLIRPVVHCQNIPNLLWSDMFNTMTTFA